MVIVDPRRTESVQRWGGHIPCAGYLEHPYKKSETCAK